MHAEKCPVCLGKGKDCIGCAGKGWVEVHDQPYINPLPQPNTVPFVPWLQPWPGYLTPYIGDPMPPLSGTTIPLVFQYGND